MGEKTEESLTTDLMTSCVTLCQENRWREAAIAGRKLVAALEKEDQAFAESFKNGALRKIDYSLRRQMAASLIKCTQNMLDKEFLLDVTK